MLLKPKGRGKRDAPKGVMRTQHRRFGDGLNSGENGHGPYGPASPRKGMYFSSFAGAATNTFDKSNSRLTTMERVSKGEGPGKAKKEALSFDERRSQKIREEMNQRLRIETIRRLNKKVPNMWDVDFSVYAAEDRLSNERKLLL